jgi:hypothetical protein
LSDCVFCLFLRCAGTIGDNSIKNQGGGINIEQDIDSIDNDTDMLQSSSGSSVQLGRQGQALDLNIDCPCEFSIITCSAKTGDVGAVRDFIAHCFA